MKKIVLLTDASNVHTQKWAKYFRDKNFEIHIISMLPAEIKDIKIHLLKSKAYANRKNNMQYNKVAVIFQVMPQIKKLLNQIKPDILHAHFASSYGFFGALSNYKPFYLSVWGYDTITFPEISIIHKTIIKYTLRKADKIFATSEFLAEKTARYTNKKQIVTPFGVNIDNFKPDDKLKSKKFIFGTVKALETKYGIDYLLKAVALIKDKLENWELWIAGTGTKSKELIELSKSLNIQNNVKFLGRVPHDKIPQLLQQMHLFTVTSVWDCESFGVAAVEAEAVELPVIASDLGGLSEVIIDGVTGFHVKPRDINDIAEKILNLYENKDLRIKLGKQARKNVIQKYIWKNNAEIMLKEYREILEK